MKTKKILHDALDIDHGLLQTFLALFSDPKKVVTHPELFTGPWKYATYVVSISCLLTWFFIHLIVDPAEQTAFWNVPRRVAELTTGYAAFYENIQPLKRLLIHSLAIYFALSLLLYKQRKFSSFLAVSLYLIGHSVFLQFIFQSIGILILRKGMLSEGNLMPTIGFITNVAYLLYALLRIYGQNWTNRLIIPVVITVEMVIYGFTSTRLQHFLFYSIFNRDKLHFTLEKSADLDSRTIALVPRDSNLNDFKDESLISLSNTHSMVRESRREDGYHIVGELAVFDSSLLVADGDVPTADEISKISVRSLVIPQLSPRWATPIFEKINRYSPDAAETFLKIDTLTQTVFSSYRIPNDSNSTISLESVDVRTGRLNYSTTLKINADDIHIYGIAMDAASLYLCGSARDILNNFELGVILKIDKRGGRIQKVNYWGDRSFSASTKFKGIKIRDNKIDILVAHDYRRLFLFHTFETSVLAIPKLSGSL
jgi:hypothetical protein